MNPRLLILFLIQNVLHFKFAKGLIDGHAASIEDFPYVVSLFLYDHFVCGGGLIRERIALTAAQCLRDKGVYNAKGGSESATFENAVRVIDYKIHPRYNQKTLDYNLALLKLESPIISRVYLKIPPYKQVILPNTSVNVTGWGTDANQSLNYAEMKVTNVEPCKKDFKNILTITQRMFCGSNPPQNACYGDLGCPVVHEEYIFGLVSGALCEWNNHTAFVQIPKLSAFIKRYTKKLLNQT